MRDDKRAVRVECVAAAITVVAAEMYGISGKVRPSLAQRDAVEQSERGFGEPHRKTVGVFFKDIATLGIDALAIGEPQLALLAIVETPAAKIGERRRPGHRRTIVDRAEQFPRPDQRFDDAHYVL